jgi:hypothetical protein
MHYYHAQCCFEKNYVIDPTSQIDFSQLWWSHHFGQLVLDFCPCVCCW